jgi:hypothetical protein
MFVRVNGWDRFEFYFVGKPMRKAARCFHYFFSIWNLEGITHYGHFFLSELLQ